MSRPVLGIPSTMNDSYQLNIRKLLERGPMLQPRSGFVEKTDNGTRNVSYIEAQKQATQIASILSNHFDINIGDSIGTFMWTNIRHNILLYSIPCMGAVFSPINFRLHPKDLGYIIQFAKHKIIFIDEDLINTYFINIAIEYLSNVSTLIICGENGLSTNLENVNILKQKFHKNVIDFDAFLNLNTIQQYKWPNLDERTGAALLFTSGTTGNPKGSLYSHRSLYIHILNIAMTDAFNLSGSDCLLCFTQIFHVISALMPLIAYMLGFKLLLHANCNDYSKILDMVLFEKCTILMGVPTIMQSFCHQLRLNPEKYKPMRGVLTRIRIGGGAPPEELIRYFWNEWNIEVIQIYGMSETQGIQHYARRCSRRSDLLLNDEEKIQNSLVGGIPFPSIHSKIIKENNNNNNNKYGEFYVFGPIVINKYYSINAKDKFDKNGWLKTGDIVSYTNKKQIIIHDRSKDMIKSGGEWISSKDMEIFIQSQYPKHIKAVCVVGVKHEIYRERPIVIIQIHENKKQISKFEIINCLKKKYANFQLPDDILYWKHIPLTGTSKISKKDVRIKLKQEKYMLPKIPLRKSLKSKL